MNKDENKSMNRQNTQEEQEFFLQVQKQGEFKIQPCESVVGFNDKDRYEMLKLTKEQKMQVNELLQHVPMAAAAYAAIFKAGRGWFSDYRKWKDCRFGFFPSNVGADGRPWCIYGHISYYGTVFSGADHKRTPYDQ